ERIEGRTKRFSAGAAGGSQPAAWLFGLADLDAALPLQTDGSSALPCNACHDFAPLIKTDVPQVAGFIFALLQRLSDERLQRGPVVWCQTAFNAREYGRIYAPGLLGSSISPEQLLFVRVPKDRDLALVLEECVRVPRVAAVVGEGPAPDFTASRRLTLAAQESHVPCLILNTGNTIGASAAATRWRIAPIAGPPDPLDPQGPGFAAWSIILSRARGGNAALNPTLAQPLKATWNHETHTFHLVSPFRPGTALESQTPYSQIQ
ncbi:MAG: ImuA family protein, partial [Ruegeria sp.]